MVKILLSGGNVPQYQTPGSSGFDLCANHKVVIPPKGIAVVSTGLRFSIPEGYEVQVRSRSGLAAKNHVFVLNSPGTVDSDYRGEVQVILCNMHKFHWHYVMPGDRIAQGVLCPVVKADFTQVEVLDETERGEGGFGSTGL